MLAWFGSSMANSWPKVGRQLAQSLPTVGHLQAEAAHKTDEDEEEDVAQTPQANKCKHDGEMQSKCFLEHLWAEAAPPARVSDLRGAVRGYRGKSGAVDVSISRPHGALGL